MIDWLKNSWTALIQPYSHNNLESDKLWYEIKSQYTQKTRYYHNLSHIYNMLIGAEEVKNSINDFDAFKFSIFYHDIIYKPTKKDNEEKSALFAEKKLTPFDFEPKRVENISKLIISTKKHQLILNDNSDNAYLLDLDLSILGTDWETYKKYLQNIRKEYRIYPDFMYKPGRKKVLHHFLKRDNLYFTDTFKSKFENQARKNLLKELKLL